MSREDLEGHGKSYKMSGKRSKRKQRERAEAEAKAKEPVEINILEYWAKHEVGGSGMGVGTQTMIKKMAIEILEARKNNDT